MSAELDAVLSDRLRELGNIGCGHALAALSQMTDTSFYVRVPDIELIGFHCVPGKLGDADEEIVSVMLDVSGGLSGVFLLLLRPRIASRILAALGVGEPRDFLDLNDAQLSAMLELGNILCSSYMNAVSELTGLDVKISIPAYAMDMLGAILNMPIMRLAQMDSELLYIRNVFTIEGKDWIGSMLLLPELDSAKRLSDCLGAWA